MSYSLQEDEIAWLNFFVLLVSSAIFLHFYVLSAQPASLEKRVGPRAYDLCARYRFVSSIFMFVAMGSYIAYYFYPLPGVPLPRTFPWPWWMSALAAAFIGIPCSCLMWLGVKDAGEETMHPKKDHALYGGIYTLIRHPQGAGEMPLWWSIAFLLNSPFLVIFSFVYVPVWLLMLLAEERDLVIRYGKPYVEYQKRTGFIFPKRKDETKQKKAR
uniref:Protein-S-isoprenylcysteine O-methyltransferase n=1 Tax=Pseudictyota dubia TaxID=2749911 RepID=A0A7R9ZCM5_9STRA|mmetsp:Transcript_4034/g.7106  ORF Transcript_4034/g.7106 Transcript_4034/m.7106 type:complete len:214 (+) Transcript_4034:115-756(+)